MDYKTLKPVLQTYELARAHQFKYTTLVLL